MRHRTVVVLAVALVLSGSVDPAAAGRAAKQRKLSPEVRALLEAKTFSDVGAFWGELGGSITLNGTEYQVASGVSVYEVGRGLAPGTLRVNGRIIAVSGIVLGGQRIVYQIIVRPDAPIAAHDVIRESPLGAGPK